MAKPTRIIHKSARGQEIDMAALTAANGSQKALGNVRMNAQGDILDQQGNIIKRRTQIVQDYYKNNPNGVKKVSLKPMGEEVFETPAEALARLQGTAKPKPTNNPNEIIPDAPANVMRKGRKMVDPDSKEEEK